MEKRAQRNDERGRMGKEPKGRNGAKKPEERIVSCLLSIGKRGVSCHCKLLRLRVGESWLYGNDDK